jgi:hypothetical protein
VHLCEHFVIFLNTNTLHAFFRYETTVAQTTQGVENKIEKTQT